MGATSDAAPQRSDNSLKGFVTAKNLTPAQRRFMRLVAGNEERGQLGEAPQ